MTEIKRLPISAIQESPFNYRKTFNQATLQELANSIASIGIQQPIKVRPLPYEQTDIYLRYEIVFGARRFRAAQLAGLDEIEVIVEDMSDDQVRVAQLSENIQREDTNPIEEAEGLRELNMLHGIRVDELAAKTGKSRSHIYNTMRLVKLSDTAKQAVIDGLIGREIAVLIATLPPPLHAKALDAVTTQIDNVTQALSYREAKRIIQKHMVISITQAPFDTTDPNLAKVRGACTGCVELAGNDETLAGELGSDVCTNVSCYEVKVKEHLRLLAEAHRAAGGEVLEGEAAEAALPHPGADWFVGYTRMDSPACRHGSEQRTPADVIAEMKDKGLPTPTVVLHTNEHTGKATPLIARAEVDRLNEYMRSTSTDADETHDTEPGGLLYERPQRTFRSPTHQAAFENRQALIEACQRGILNAPSRQGLEVRLMATAQLMFDDVPDALVEHYGWAAEIVADSVQSYNVGSWIVDNKLAALTDDDCARILVCLMLQNGPGTKTFSDSYPDDLVAMAELYGIDIEALAAAKRGTDAGADEDDDDASMEAV